MDTLTLQQSTIRGTVQGKAVLCSLRGFPAGLQLAAGNYLLRTPQNSPVYGPVMAIEPLPAAAEAVAHKVSDPAAIKYDNPAAIKYGNPAAMKYGDPAAIKYGDPAAIKFNVPSAVKFSDPAAPSNAWDVMPPVTKHLTDPSAQKVSDPVAFRYRPAAAIATLGTPSQNVPAIKFDTAAGQVIQPVVISERNIAGNCFIVTVGFGDLVDVVQRAGVVRLVVV